MIIKRKENSKWEPATVVQNSESSRSYIVRYKSNGELYRRNRTHLRPTKACFTPHGDDREDVPYLHPEDNHQSENNHQPPADIPLPVPTTEGTTTRSGRNVKMPPKYSDFVMTKSFGVLMGTINPKIQ
ncbi:hypothetical protein DPMN_049958 [Dreissena polymorpha]|uniref:Uncharacterized protein n=1 Tax=Dreissena polymorpha TaxID=45954 RepID=A0A9D4CGI8_DREPO|nr:hypothetical protein DPMN_049958 [Dreissena polymorpha]